MLAVFDQRARDGQPVELLRRFEEKQASRVLGLDARRLHAAEGALLEAAEPFEALGLGPALPFGATRTLGGIHQNNVLSAVRGLEVAGDPSLALALEAARRRRHSRSKPVRLCASQRVIRMQPLPDPSWLPHFQLFAAVTASRGGSILEALREHASIYLRVLAPRAERVVLEVSDSRRVLRLLAEQGVEVQGQFRAHDPASSAAYLAERGVVLPRGRGLDARLESEVLGPLEREFPALELVIDLGRCEGLSYYSGPMLRILAARAAGPLLHLVDGGRLDWTGRLLADRSEWVLASGIGVDRLAQFF
ncbi:MAG: hypothetical protein AMXMBFR33_27040 [Candidatus Xenobia bacterium]